MLQVYTKVSSCSEELLAWDHLANVLEHKSLEKMLTTRKELGAEVWLLLPLPHYCVGNVLQCWFFFLIRALANSKLGKSWGFEKSSPRGFPSPTLFHVTCKGKFWDFYGCWNYHFEFKGFFSNSECCRLTFVRAGPKGETKSWDLRAAAEWNRLSSVLYPVLLAPLITQGQLKTQHLWNITSLEWVPV